MHVTIARTVNTLTVLGATVALLLGCYQVFRLYGVTGWVISTTEFYYASLACLLPLVFLHLPLKKGGRPLWVGLDFLLAALSLGCFIFFAVTARESVDNAWSYLAPLDARIISAVGLILVIEGARRAGGNVILGILILLGLYPVWAQMLPLVFPGIGLTLPDLVAYHMFSEDSLTGLATRAFVDYVIGFVLFGAILSHTGAGQFFLGLSFSLLGRTRGGPAKVAVLSSGLMGSLSGAVTSNVITTGSITIPSMIRSGILAKRAAAIEACASTGGVFMPPIMGSTAFVMASFLNVPYFELIVAAFIPAVLYYVSLILQIDAYAGAKDLPRVAEEDIPPIWQTVREGWLYVLAFALLVYLMLGLQQEGRAPYIAGAAVLVLNQFTSGRLSIRGLYDIIRETGTILVSLGSVIAGISLVVGALMASGMVGTLTNDMIRLAGENGLLLLIMGAATCFVLGIGMTITAAYVFLAIVLAPGLGKLGYEPMAIHLFIMYWSMVSFITPPVAIAAFAAASIAKVPPMSVGVEAVRFGSVIFFVPFLFVYDNKLLMMGSWEEILRAVAFAVVALWLLASACQGYLPLGGRLPKGYLRLPTMLLLAAAALCLVFPAEYPAAWVLRGVGLAMASGAVLVCISSDGVRDRERSRAS